MTERQPCETLPKCSQAPCLNATQEVTYDEFADEGDLYQCSSCDDLEDRESYRIGGYHPIHIGDRLGDGHQYRVLHKLGFGRFSTIWLCRDSKDYRYVAVKIITANQSHSGSPELNVMKLSGNLRDAQVGGDKIAIPEDYFWIYGPNGSHLCLVLSVLGPCLPDIEALIEGPREGSRNIASQVVDGLDFLHRNGLCHGDLRPSNILLKIAGLDEITEEKLVDILEEPYKDAVLTTSGGIPGPAAPEYLVRPINLWRLGRQIITDQICIVDFDQSFEYSTSPKRLSVPAAYAPLEITFNGPAGFASDVWALACSLYEIRLGVPLFGWPYEAKKDVISRMIRILGHLPKSLSAGWKDKKCFPDPGCLKYVNGSHKKTDALKKCLGGEEQHYTDYRTGERKSIRIPQDELELFVDLLGQMLVYEPGDRISTAAVKRHPWVSGK